ncbi:hypothetical protein WR25_04608 [Diploscapter pachys]|uniref:Neurotransmitter-gated ion-channel transmembrane domain-containing protein n=1 Tax=Diploscapter pachys TaxID=2018661 RepID=A0A2A2LKS5_9BILA|nr:hypothetical protein WR25_04608 [Diploscapter pachys]
MCLCVSDGYAVHDIDYFWGDKRTDPPHIAIKFGSDLVLPQFEPSKYNVNNVVSETDSGKYNRLVLTFLFTRNIGFYAMNIVIPSVLIVTISWVSFWLNREASPARVGLGVTTVLTMTTLITTTNNSMPKVSYIKGLDVFLNFCFVMVFASLVEYAIVSYMTKRMILRREKRRKAAEQQQRSEMPMFGSNISPKSGNNNADMYYPGHNTSMNPLMEIPENCDCRTIPLMQNPRLIPDNANTLWPAPFARPKKPKKTCIQRWTPAKIDKVSRYGFPIVFIVFNVAYWIIMQHESLKSQTEGFDQADWHSVFNDDTDEIAYYWCSRDNDNCTGIKKEEIELPSYAFDDRNICMNRTVFKNSSGTNRRLPPVSYIKAVDVYLGFSYLLVVLALIEYAFVAYTKKKNEDRKRKDKRMGGGSERRQPIQTPAAPDIVTDARLAECTCNSMPVSIIAVMQKKEKYCLRHSHIDIGSRFFFPLTFTIFNLLFWIILLAKAKRLPFFSDIEQFRCINFPFHDE